METNSLPWDRRSSVSTAQTLPPLANITGKPSSANSHSPSLSQQSGDLRDSGNWSMASTRVSNISESFSPQLTLPPIDAHGPSRQHSQENNGAPSFSYNHSPTGSTFTTSNTSLHHTTPPGTMSQDGALPTPSPSASRRSSFDSRLSNLQLSSPINGTPAASQVSLASTLQRERGIQTRTAPPIGASRFSYNQGQVPHPNAPSPTKGFPYAFPDPDLAPPGRTTSREGITPGRISTGSLPGSAASSIYSSNSLRPGHHSHMSTDNSSTAIAYSNNQYQTGMNGNHHHHHHLQQDRKSSLGPSEAGSLTATPYSRTPELRVSHKLAERKRRKEMKDLFDELRDQLPAERGGKSSKWEVLTKAIEYINQLKQNQDNMGRTIEQLQHEVETLRNENHMRLEMQENLRIESAQSFHHPSQPNAYHPQTHHAAHNSVSNGPGRMQGIERC
ncbi:uncharacterized protein LAJ45_06294 [Morchella importuna]|uniref:uncharacterized protein n=1 Tax=Morchella importuna TaxID=1174673 RepID=UPI001E8DFD9C|nr:uncharacterized protein LAJ45_06294 [Morchella importuna]KAH8149663.1 hypothetical protein LAJ45_06294 [Morchella importuna]